MDLQAFGLDIGSIHFSHRRCMLPLNAEAQVCAIHKPFLTHSLSATTSSIRLTVRLLVSGTGTGTAKLLGLASTVVGNEECPVVLHQGLLELVLCVLVNVFLVVGDLHACVSAV